MNRRWLITRQRAYWLTLLIVIFVIIYNHPFLFWPKESSFSCFELFNHTIVYACQDAQYQIYGFSFSLKKLIYIENIGLRIILI